MLVNLILWGNYPRLSESALDELGDELPGATLQVACVYGDLTEQLCARAAAGGGRVDIVDVLPIQLANLRSNMKTRPEFWPAASSHSSGRSTARPTSGRAA